MSTLHNLLTPELAQSLMREALNHATYAYNQNEVPIGAVVWHAGKIIGAGHNQVEACSAVTRHAEIVAIEQAGKALGTWRLNEAIFCVTVEPCMMCVGALIHANISTVIFGVSQPNDGCLGSQLDLRTPNVRVIQGILELECKSLMTSFFREKRASVIVIL